MAYFRTSYQAVRSAAKSGRYEDAAAFIVLARHANGRPPAGLAPYKFSGAGVNAVHEKAGLSEETARAAVLRLQEFDLICPASIEVKKLSYSARWEINQDNLDLDLPHLLTDSVEGISSALRRIRGLTFQDARKDAALSNTSDSGFKLDVLMMLLAIYRHTSMNQYGGLSPQCCFRLWEIKSQTPKSGGIRWGAEPETERVFPTFIEECISRNVQNTKTTPTDEHKKRFWVAWGKLKELGLIYEAVALFDVDPFRNSTAQLTCTLRVNDYHAGSAGKNGDPSLLGLLEANHGSSYAFYTPVTNERGEPEAMWVILPNKAGAIVGVWRPRFRVSNQDTGSWYENDTSGTDAIYQVIVKAADQF